MSSDKKLGPWKAAYELAYMQPKAEVLEGTAIFDLATKAGADKTTSALLARLELFTIASVGALAQEGQQNASVLALQLHNDLNNRTSYLAREVGRLWRAMPSPSLGSSLYNSVAGSVIGQRLGLMPIQTTQPEPFNPVPPGPNRHKDTAFPPTLSSKLATITGGGGSIVLTEPEPRATDSAFQITVTFGAGSSALLGDLVCEVNFGSSYDVIPVVTFSNSGSGSFFPLPLVATNVTKTGFLLKTFAAVGGNHVFLFNVSVTPSAGDSTF